MVRSIIFLSALLSPFAGAHVVFCSRGSVGLVEFPEKDLAGDMNEFQMITHLCRKLFSTVDNDPAVLVCGKAATPEFII